ncbi:MAG: ATP-binding protein [Lachnospiraceae bacterium]|nr:ATP-binding protein [Lachnospiraceae bacterium]
MERNDRLIRKKIKRYMLTGVMTTVALQLGNVVDAMIVGNLLGSLGNGAINASTPFLYILQAAAILMGSGGAVSIAILLGKREIDSAGRVMGLCIVTSLVYPLIFTCLSPLIVPLYTGHFSAAPQLSEMVRSITTVYSLGMPIISFVLVMAYLINVDNNPGMATKLHITSNAVNLVLDFILVKFTPLGITGAALSTVIGYLVAGLIFIPRYFKSSGRMVTPVFKGLFKSKDLGLSTVKNGFPNLAYLVMTVISVSILNSNIIRVLGDSYFSAYSVTANTQLIVQMFLNGVSSTIASVAGVLFGEKDYFGMRRVFSRVQKIALLISLIIMAVFLIVPQGVAALYGFDNDNVRGELMTGIRLFSMSFVFFSLNALTQNYYRTIGQTFLSTISSVFQLLLLKIPLMLAFMHIFGFTGLFAAIIMSELLAFIIVNILRLIMQHAKKVPQKGFLAIPEKNEGAILDISISGSDKEAVRVSERIIDYCRNDGISESNAQTLGIAAEELIDNIARHGYREAEDKDIDVCLSKTEGKYYLRLRDDGMPFDPAAYVSEEGEETEFGGLKMLKSMGVRMNYVRTLNLNNTVIEVKI